MTTHRTWVALASISVLITSTAAAPPARCGRGTGQAGCRPWADTAPATAPAAVEAGLNAREHETLTNMRREEQLAHDVYLAFGRRFDLQPFRNIPHAEARHIDAVVTLMSRYQVDDPMAGLEAGRFDVPDMQAMFDRLLDAGSKDAVAALKAGAEIEELDIVDLQRAGLETTHADVRDVYARLEAASMRHLQAFVRNLTRLGVTYTPTHLSQEAFDKAVEPAKDPGPQLGARSGRGAAMNRASGQQARPLRGRGWR